MVARLRAARDEHDEATERLLQLLGDVSVDEYDDELHGLSWWYPQVKHWPTVRSVASGGGGRAGAPLPLNADAVDFVSGTYWSDPDRPMPQAKTDRDVADLANPENYRLGFELTVLELEKSVRRALGQLAPPHRPTVDDPLQPQPAVVAALDYLREFSPEIAADGMLTELVAEEARRLIVRARGMMHGSRWAAGRGPCMHCHQPDSVISDEDRAVCIAPMCRTATGDRHCWRYLTVGDVEAARAKGVDSAWLEVGWLEVPEPDLRGRGQVSDEQLSRWTETG